MPTASATLARPNISSGRSKTGRPTFAWSSRAAIDLVYSVRGRAEKVLPFRRDGSGVTVTGQRTLYLEDLGVEPGDFVTYYARATDVSRGKRSSEARSDIFFLEIKPFEEEFVAAQSQAMGAGGGGGDKSLEDLATAQKEIIVATWK